MFWNYNPIFFLLIIVLTTNCTLTLPSSIRNLKDSVPDYKTDTLENNYGDDNDDHSTDKNERVLVPEAFSYLSPLSKVSIPVDSSSILSLPSEEETRRLKLALALQVESEVARAIRLKNEANKLTDQSELLDKEALEAQRYAVVASEMLKSLKQLWDENNNNAATNVNDEDNYIKEGDLIVPKINHDYLLDAEKSSAINSGDRNVDGDHSIDNHGSNSRRNEERRLSMPSDYNRRKRRKFVPELQKESHLLGSTRHTYNYFDDNDDFSAQDLLRGSDQNTRHLSETEQLTLEKIRLFILKQLIQQIKHEGKQTDERYYLNHHLTSDNDDGVTNRHGYHQYDSDSQHYNRKQDQYDRFSGIDLQPWLTFNRKGYGDEMNNSDERDLYGTE